MQTLEKQSSEKPSLPLAIIAAGLILALAVFFGGKGSKDFKSAEFTSVPSGSSSPFEEQVIPSGGVELPVVWGDLGNKLVSVGAIDKDKFESLYAGSGTFSPEFDRLLSGDNPARLSITRENSGYLLNLFWALGLANKNEILDLGEMKNPAYGGANRFASTAGWTLAAGDPMIHYSAHKFFPLTSIQQALVDRVSRNIFRPCCGNSTHFPDCNHGLAMLGLLELMASQGASENEMYKTALVVNSYWFPDTYLAIAAYEEQKGVEWSDVDPKEVLGVDYSSAAGYARVAAGLKSYGGGSFGGGGCDVGSAAEQSASNLQNSSC